MSESKSPARSFSIAEASSASTSPTSDNNTPNTKESLAWFRSRRAQWKGSPRRKIQAFPSLLPLYTPLKSVNKERTVTATDISTSVSIRQQPMSQPHSMKSAAVIHPLDRESFAPTTTSPRQSLIPSTTTTFKQRQQQRERNDDTTTTTSAAVAVAVTATASTTTVHLLLVILLRNATARSAAATRTATAAASTTTSSLSVSTKITPSAFGTSGGSGA